MLPADIDPTVILPLLIRSLASALGADNAQSADRIRMRMAVSVGLIERGLAGFGGQLIVDINRLVDSARAARGAAEAPCRRPRGRDLRPRLRHGDPARATPASPAASSPG